MKYFNVMFLPVFVMYAVQRGFATLAESGMMPDFFPLSMQIFFVTVAFSVLLLGPLLDNVNTKLILLGSLIMGIVGIIVAPINPWIYGIVFGIAMGVVKLVPFSTPLRVKMYDISALRIAFQSSAKNFGGAFFILFLGTIFKDFGFQSSCFILAFFLVSALALCNVVLLPIDKVQGWSICVFKIVAKKKIFWKLMLYFFFMSGFYWLTVMNIYPSLVENDYSPDKAITLIAISFIFAGLFRWVTAYIGDKLYSRMFLLITGTIGMMCCYLLRMQYPLLCLGAFSLFSAIHTPNYWTLIRERFEPEYINTIMALGYFSMYLGAGIMYGKWM